MKTKLFIAIAGAIFTLQLLNAQTSYMPVFGNDSTTFYYNIYVGNVVSAFYKQNWIKKTNSNMYIQTQGMSQGYEVVVGDSIEVSPDNSKIWVHTLYDSVENRTLVMDLNLEVGDTFYCPIAPNFESYRVQEIATINGRKHIVFEKKIDVAMCVKCDGTDYVEYMEFTLKFIEGIGPNISFMTCFPTGNSREGVPILCSQNKDGNLSYGIPEFYPYWGLDGISTKRKEVSASRLSAYPIPVDKFLELSLPENINFNDATIAIKSISGTKLLTYPITSKKICVDLSSLLSGVYLVEVYTTDYRDVIKIIKK